MPESEDQLLAMRDIMDSQLETSDKHDIGRVADIEAEWRDDGKLVLTNIVTGPQALTGRVASRLRPIARFLLRDRFEHRIPLSEVENFGPTLRLRGKAKDYAVGQSDRWIADHILRWIRRERTLMPNKRTATSIEDLVGSKIVTAEGKRVGHVVDIQITLGPEHEVSRSSLVSMRGFTVFTCSGLLQRHLAYLTSHKSCPGVLLRDLVLCCDPETGT